MTSPTLVDDPLGDDTGECPNHCVAKEVKADGSSLLFFFSLGEGRRGAKQLPALRRTQDQLPTTCECYWLPGRESCLSHLSARSRRCLAPVETEIEMCNFSEHGTNNRTKKCLKMDFHT